MIGREGQIFVVGTLLFITLIVGIVFLSQSGGISSIGPETPQFLFDKSMDEFPRAVNLGSTNSSAFQIRNRVVSYLNFQGYMLGRHGSSDYAHTMILVPNSNGVSAVVANFRNRDMEETLVSVDGTEEDLGTLNHGEARIHTFTGVSPRYRANMSFTSGEEFDHSFTASRSRITALYRLEVESIGQVWKDTEIY